MTEHERDMVTRWVDKMANDAEVIAAITERSLWPRRDVLLYMILDRLSVMTRPDSSDWNP